MSNDKVKITIRLSAPLVKAAKMYALALDEDLQDLVERVLWEAVREPLPAGLYTRGLARRQGQPGPRARSKKGGK